MKAGTENKTKLTLAIVLCVVAAGVIAWTFLSGRTTPDAPVAAAAVSGSAAPAPAESLDPRLRLDLLANSEDVKYQGRGKNIFRTVVEIEKPKVSPMKPKVTPQPVVNLPPPPPPINLKFFGTTNARGEKPKVFLSQGDDVWIAHEGDVVNRRYKILRILPTTVEVEDLLNNNRQSIPLSQG